MLKRGLPGPVRHSVFSCYVVFLAVFFKDGRIVLAFIGADAFSLTLQYRNAICLIY